MSDYIKREDAIRQIVKTSARDELDIPAIGTVLNILSEMDSADVRENVRGEWIDRGKDMTIRWQCSECGRKDTHIYNFCPNCGASMRGDNK